MVRKAHPGRRTPGTALPLSTDALGAAVGSAELLLVDRVDIGYWGDPVTDPDTLETVTPFVPLHTDQPALVETDQPRDRTVQFAEQPVYIGAFFVSVPLSIADVEEGHIIRVTRSHDPRCQGAQLTVRDSEHSTVFPLRHLVCTETSRQEP